MIKSLTKSLTIKQLLLLAFLLAGLLPALLVSTLGFYQARNALKAEIEHDMRTLNAAVASDIAGSMTERMHNVHTWSQLGIMQDLQIGDVDKRLANFLQELQQSYGEVYTEIVVTNNHGTVVASSNAHSIGLQAAQNKAFRPARFPRYTVNLAPLEANKLAISHVITDPQTQQVIGQLTAYFNWRVMEKLINTAIPPPSAAALIDENDAMLAQTDNWHTLQSHHEMRVETALSNDPALPRWTLRLEKLHSVAVAPVHRLGYAFLGLLLATIIVSALLVKPIANAITKPLENLRKFVKTAGLQPNIHAPAGGPPEVQALSNAFETMLHDLDESQQQLTRAAKLAVVGEMAAALSHEVRTPLGILRSSADLLQREPRLSKDGREVTGFIISETERLNKLVTSLIDAARPNPPDFKPLNIAMLAEDVVGMLKPQADAKNINIKLDVLQQYLLPPQNIPAEAGYSSVKANTPGHPLPNSLHEFDSPCIHADAGQMTQVLMNLLQNAIQILPEGGTVELRVLPSDEFVEIQVNDNGPGIALENQAHIFEPFFTQRAGGVGLGLAVVKQIVQAHSGSIHYAPSRLGGAGFTIRLPRL